MGYSIPSMSDEINDQVVFPSDGEILNSLLAKYTEELNQATASTEESIKNIKQSMINMERNSIMIKAQQGMIMQLKKDMESVKASQIKNNQ